MGIQPVLQELLLSTVLQAEQMVHILLKKQRHDEYDEYMPCPGALSCSGNLCIFAFDMHPSAPKAPKCRPESAEAVGPGPLQRVRARILIC